MKILHPDNAVTAISWRGEAHEPDADGVFDVPDEAVPEMASFGLVPAPDAPPAKRGRKKAEE